MISGHGAWSVSDMPQWHWKLVQVKGRIFPSGAPWVLRLQEPESCVLVFLVAVFANVSSCESLQRHVADAASWAQLKSGIQLAREGTPMLPHSWDYVHCQGTLGFATLNSDHVPSSGLSFLCSLSFGS